MKPETRAAMDYVTPKAQATFTAKDMRTSFEAGAAYARAHQFMPPEINPVKAAEEALARWPD